MVGVSADTDKSLDVRVPRSHIVVGNRPVHPVTEFLRRDELVLAPPLTRATPDDRLAAHLIAADPVERLLLDVWMVAVLDEEMHGVFAVTRRFADQRIFLEDLTRCRAAVWQLPRVQVHGRIVLDVDHVATAFEDQRFEPLLAQFFRRPTPGDSRADNNCVVRRVFFHCERPRRPGRELRLEIRLGAGQWRAWLKDKSISSPRPRNSLRAFGISVRSSHATTSARSSNTFALFRSKSSSFTVSSASVA